MNVIQMITICQLGIPSEGVPSLCMLTSKDVRRFDKDGGDLSKMKMVMAVVKIYAKRRGIWKPLNVQNYWNGATVLTALWDGVWTDLAPALSTVAVLPDTDNNISERKSRAGSLAWRTC
jgi:hypothetical protein